MAAPMVPFSVLILNRSFHSKLMFRKYALTFSNSVRSLRSSRVSIAREKLTKEEEKYQLLLKLANQNSEPSPDSVVNTDNSTVIQACNMVKKHVACTTESTLTGVDFKSYSELLHEKITPLMKLSYTRQLEFKYNKSLAFLRKFGLKLEALKVPISLGQDKLPCPLDFAVPSPVTEAYRNKDEFSIRHGVDGNPKRIGFYLESPTDNPDTPCISPNELIIIKDQHKSFIKDFETYLEKSSLPPCIKFDDGGHWRTVTARSNSNGDLMGIIVMHPQNLSKIELEAEKAKIKEYFSSLVKEYNLKSLYFQACTQTRCTHEQAPFELLMGDPYISEVCNARTFRISPGSLFQTNTRAAERLYSSLLKLLKPKDKTTILDICCGTGPVSLILAPHVKKCIGIDVSRQAIEDAKFNAKANNVHNVEFLQGQSEDLLRTVFNQYHNDLVAVLNPGGSGLGKAAIHCLRQCKYLKKIVYISCKPEGTVENFIQLCKPCGSNQSLGKSFLPFYAVPVDLFPHTKQCELVIMFQRL